MDRKVSFFSLGGLGEIGLNSYVYSHIEDQESQYLMVDLGVGFKDNKLISVDTFFPDISFFVNNEITPQGIIITHGHEDHIGAIPYLIPYLDCPIYATKWTLDLIRTKLKDFNLHDKVKLVEVTHGKEYEIGKFRVSWFPVYHSIIDSNLLSIKTSSGHIVHTGDFKLKKSDSSMLSNLQQISKEQVDYLVCDSTNVMEKGFAGEDIDIKYDLRKIISRAKGASWIGMFSSNLERIKLICEIAKELKKQIVIYGRSLHTYTDLAIKHDYLEPNLFISHEDVKNIDRKKLIILATGSQGEDRSALYNVIIRNEYKEKIREKDIVIFSSAVIPGNETKINKYYNILADRDIEFFTEREHNIHVSGHAKQDELLSLYNTLNPEHIIPMHGEIIHLREHVNFANDNGFKASFFHVGEIVELFNGDPKVSGNIPLSKLTYDGNRVVDYEEDFFKQRTKMFFEGSVFLSISLDSNYDIDYYKVDMIGLLSEEEKLSIEKKISGRLQDLIFNLKKTSYEDIKEELRLMLRRFFREKMNKKPIIVIHLTI